MAKKQQAADADGNEIQEEVTPKLTKNIRYEEYPVKVIRGKDRITFEKTALKPIRVTSITEDRANELNTQSENTNLRLYPAEEE